MKLEVHLDGIETVKKAVENILNTAQFKESASDDYKAAFYLFGRSVIHALEDIQVVKEEGEKCGGREVDQDHD